MTITLYNANDSLLDALKTFVAKWQGVEMETDEGDVPNALTEKVLAECDAGKNMSRAYSNISELMDSLDA